MAAGLFGGGPPSFLGCSHFFEEKPKGRGTYPTVKFVRLSTPAICLLATTGCIRPPIHDDPSAVDQVSNGNFLRAAGKDRHWDEMEHPVIDQRVAGLLALNVPGCAVGVTQNDEIVYMQTYGDERLNGPPFDYDTMAPVASISKTFTAAAIMRLVERGLLNLDDEVSDFFPHIVNSDVRDATIEELLTHAAGLEDFPSVVSETTCTDFPGASAAFCASHPAIGIDHYAEDLQPGSAYSNSSYAILGAIIDRVTQDEWLIAPDEKGYEPYVWATLGHYLQNNDDQREFTSMALSHPWRYSEANPNSSDMPTYALGTCTNGTPCAIDASGPWAAPAGYWAMTIGDLTRFVRAVSAREILQTTNEDSTWDFMFIRRNDVLGSVPEDEYGLGTMQSNDGIGGPREFWHGGDHDGMASIWYLSERPHGDIGVALVCNGRGPLNSTVVLRAVAQDIARAIVTPPVFKTSIGTFDARLASVVDGRRYRLGAIAGRLSSHRRLFLPLAAASHWDVAFARGRSGTTARMSGVRDARGRPLSLGTLAPSGRTHVESRPQTAVFDLLGGGSVTLMNGQFRFAFDSKGHRLAQTSLQGTIDLRNLASMPQGPDWRNLCETSKAQDGQPCLPCADGVAACLDVAWDRLSGKRL